MYRLGMWQSDACVGDCKQPLRQQEQTSYQEIPQERVAASFTELSQPRIHVIGRSFGHSFHVAELVII